MSASRSLTQTLKLVGGRGEQQLALHAAGAGAAGDARLLVAALHPVGEPEQAAVAVQRVGSDRPEGSRKRSQGSEVTGGEGKSEEKVESCGLGELLQGKGREEEGKKRRMRKRRKRGKSEASFRAKD